MMTAPDQRATALAKRAPHIPPNIMARMQAHLHGGTFPERGIPAAMNDFYHRLAQANVPPDLVTQEIYAAVATSRTRLRALLNGLRVAELQGMNLLTLESHVLNAGFINRRLKEDFEIHGHLVRTLLTDLIRRERPNARWAAQHMLGHSGRYMQETYRSDFAESGAVLAMDQRIGEVQAGK